ncbi:Uncharacterised protein [Vibrio cholerae]|nr:Uncharacterised protein [Vibrio cholerae]CSC99037.1 Uncharacterised protein [Vibrio cholerae]
MAVSKSNRNNSQRHGLIQGLLVFSLSLAIQHIMTGIGVFRRRLLLIQPI